MVNSVEYDRCRAWIKMKRNLHNSWDDIRLACKSDEQGLKGFLENRKDEDNWPSELNTDIWKQIVDQMEELERQKIQLENANRMAMLHDGSKENNRVYVPIDERSSWQQYRKHLKEKKHFSEDAVVKIEKASIEILKRLSSDTVESGPVKGLVIGNVQSGKTANMAGLMAMAADWGWNMFIVLSGTIESLRKQTQNRLYNDLNHRGNIVWAQFEHLSRKKSPISQRLCDLHLEPDSPMRYMTVCLKVKSRLEDLIEWIETDKQNIKNLKVLVIDDEADQAGVNTGDVYTASERKTINRLILNLVHCRDKNAINNETNKFDSHYQAMNYISYTATPYANCLNEIGDETLYPKNFIRTLDITNSYFGPDRFFNISDINSNKCLDLVRNISDKDVRMILDIEHGKDNKLPGSLKRAIAWFLCATAVMRFYNYKKPISMLIHTSQKQSDHQAVAEAVTKWLKYDKKEIFLFCSKIYEKETSRFSKSLLRKHYPEYEYPDNEIWDYPLYKEILPLIQELVNEISSIMLDAEGEFRYCRGIHLCIDNCANNGRTDDGMHMRLAYPDEKSTNVPDYATAFIVIGGNTLSRGLTLEGLVSTFFLRSVKQADTLMQMGRWFGYRPHYELLQRVWLTSSTIRKFEFLTDIDLDLREQIYQMQMAGNGPMDFSLALKASPKVSWLSLTSKNKMQMAITAEYDFSGMDTQLTVYSKNKADQDRNMDVTTQFFEKLTREKKYRPSENTAAYIWENIPFSFIKEEFFKKGFIVPETSRAFQQIDPLEEWISKQTEKGKMKNWNVILCGNKITVTTPEKNIWRLSDKIKIGKINRTCKVDSDDHINIGVLSGKKDYVADITKEMLNEKTWKEMCSGKNISSEYQEYRKAAKVDAIPLFLVYIINRNSSSSRSNKENSRTSLHMDNDLIGITMVTPGIRGKNCERIKIKPLTEDEGEGK